MITSTRLSTALFIIALTLVPVLRIYSTPNETTVYAPCRHGYTYGEEPLGYYGATILGRFAAGHVYGYYAQLAPSNPTGLEIYQMVRIDGEITTYTFTQSPSTYEAIALANPTALWWVGNEPDNRYQDNVTPEVYALAYRAAYLMIRGFDPTARVSIGAITQATPLRLEWLTRFVAEYVRLYGTIPPTYAFGVHGYQFREVRNSWGADIPVGLSQNTGMLYTWQDTISFPRFVENIVRMREWMKATGYQSTPLFVTEYGPGDPSSYPGSWSQVARYVLTDTMGYMARAASDVYGYPQDNYRLVQRFNMFALDNSPGVNDTRLVNYPDRTLTPLGLAWEIYVRSPLSGLAPCSPGLENAVKQVFVPMQRLQNVGVYP